MGEVPEKERKLFSVCMKDIRNKLLWHTLCVHIFCAFSISMHKKLNLWLDSSWQWFIFIHHCPLTGLNNYNLSYHLRLSLTFGCLCPAAHLCLSLYLLINWFVLKITLKVSDPELLAVSLYSWGYKASIWLELKKLTLFSFLRPRWRNKCIFKTASN